MSINSNRHTVAIIGGGLAGLYAAYQLTLQHIDFVLLEAKPELGGRIAGVLNEQGSDEQCAYYNDLGPTWIFEHQSKMQALVAKLGLSLFEQYTAGDTLYQLTNANQPRRVAGAGNGNARMFRVEGGTYKIIEALARKIDKQSIQLNTVVTELSKTSHAWTLRFNTEQAPITADHVLIAIPPRLASRDLFTLDQEHQNTENSIISQALLSALNRSQTWMAAQAKFVVTYARPFWRKQGLSGQSFSQVGPMVEMHDASFKENGGYALFGFIGVPALHRTKIGRKALQAACLKQLAFLYGDQVYDYQSAVIKDWAADPHICTQLDLQESSKHPDLKLLPFAQELQLLSLGFIGSEYANVDPGYLEGAIDAVDTMLASLFSQS